MTADARAAAGDVRPLPEGVRLAGAIVAVALTAGILLGGRVPEAVQMLSSFWDKGLHATAYAAVAASWCVAFGGRRMTAAAVLAICTGALDETLQASLPGRQPDFADLAADAVGALCGAWLASTFGERAWHRFSLGVGLR